MRRRPHSTYPDPSGDRPALPQTYHRGGGILTPFPFGGYLLGPTLGPAHSRLTNVAGKPWPFSAEGILTPLRCYSRRDLHLRPVQQTLRPAFWPTAAPPYRVDLNEIHPLGLGSRLEPRPICRAPSLGG